MVQQPGSTRGPTPWAIRRETLALGRGQSTDPHGSKHYRAKGRLNATGSAHAPQASPGHLAFSRPDVYFCFPALGDSCLPTAGSVKAPSCPIPGGGAGQASDQPLSAKAPKQPAGLQMDGLTRNQLAPGLSWLFTALGSITVWLLTQQPCLGASLRAPEKFCCKACLQPVLDHLCKQDFFLLNLCPKDQSCFS